MADQATSSDAPPEPGVRVRARLVLGGGTPPAPVEESADLQDAAPALSSPIPYRLAGASPVAPVSADAVEVAASTPVAPRVEHVTLRKPLVANVSTILIGLGVLLVLLAVTRVL